MVVARWNCRVERRSNRSGIFHRLTKRLRCLCSVVNNPPNYIYCVHIKWKAAKVDRPVMDHCWLWSSGRSSGPCVPRCSRWWVPRRLSSAAPTWWWCGLCRCRLLPVYRATQACLRNTREQRVPLLVKDEDKGLDNWRWPCSIWRTITSLALLNDLHLKTEWRYGSVFFKYFLGIILVLVLVLRWRFRFR